MIGPMRRASSALLSTPARQPRHALARVCDRHRRAARSRASRRSCPRVRAADHARQAPPNSLCVQARTAVSKCAAPSRLRHSSTPATQQHACKKCTGCSACCNVAAQDDQQMHSGLTGIAKSPCQC